MGCAVVSIGVLFASWAFSRAPVDYDALTETAITLLKDSHFATAIQLLSAAQGAKPKDPLPLRIFHGSLLAAATGNNESRFTVAREEASNQFDQIYELLLLSAPEIRRTEIRGLRHAYQSLFMPDLASRISMEVLLHGLPLKPVDEAEFVLEAGRFADAEKHYAKLAAADPLATDLRSQLSRIKSELRAEEERREVVRILEADGASQGHWALERPPFFTEVERREASGLSYDAFVRSFVKAGVPVILTGIESFQGWGWDHVTQLCGEMQAKIHTHLGGNASTWGGLRATQRMVRLGDWIAKLRAGAVGGSEDAEDDGGFVFDFGLVQPKAGCPQLVESFVVPRFFANDIFKRLPAKQRKTLDPFPHHPGLFAQPKGSKSSLHVDKLDSHFFQVLLEGQKRWAFYALEPERQRLLLSARRKFNVIEHGPGRGPDLKWSGVIGGDGTDSAQTLMHAAERFRVEVMLEKGEVLYVPGGLAHEVSQLEASLAVSMNYVDETNLEHVIDQLEWQADFNENPKRRSELGALRTSHPHYNPAPEDIAWREFVGA